MMHKKTILKNYLEGIDGHYTVDDIIAAWIEIVSRRIGGDRKAAAAELGISMSTYRRMINTKSVRVPKANPVGRPRKYKKTPKAIAFVPESTPKARKKCAKV